MQYRGDIDGLRAIAVLAVVIFHLDVPGFEGGFVGVDIFFVISGYLITSIIKGKFERNSFTFSDFYLRRIRRLIPPLIVTVVATLICAGLVMTPYDMERFSLTAAAALLSLSNIVFYLEAGYWDTASELKPLLHTWSLGVEEQFYLFWPGLIVALLGIRKSVPFGVSLTLIFLLGSTLSIWFTFVDQSAAFYLLPFRVFQFAAGALLIPLTSALQREAGSDHNAAKVVIFWAGILLIGISISLLGENRDFPGWIALLPTTGAVLILLAGASWSQGTATHTSKLMNNGVSLWLGRVSYSMYLVHWPLISLYRYHYGQDLLLPDQVALLLATIVATGLLHYGVERRFYSRGTGDGGGSTNLDNAIFARRTGLASLVLALAMMAIWFNQGSLSLNQTTSMSLTAEQIKQGQKDRLKKYDRACSLASWMAGGSCNKEATLQVLIFGDSHEPDGFNFLQAAYGQDRSVNLIVFGGMNTCKDFELQAGRFVSSDKQCQQRLDVLSDPAFHSQLAIVYYSALRPYGNGHLRMYQALKKLKESNPGLRIITQGGYLKTRRHCSYYISKTNSSTDCVLPDNVIYFADQPQRMPLYNKFRSIEDYYIDRVDLLCDSRRVSTCRSKARDGTPVFYDKSHQSIEFAEMAGRLYAKEHPDLLYEIAD